MEFNKEYEPGHGRDTITEFKKSEGQKLKDAEEMGFGDGDDKDLEDFELKTKKAVIDPESENLEDKILGKISKGEKENLKMLEYKKISQEIKKLSDPTLKKIAERILENGREGKVAIFKDYFNKKDIEVLRSLPERDIIDFYNKFYYRTCKNSHIRCDFRLFKNFLNELSQPEEEKVAA